MTDTEQREQKMKDVAHAVAALPDACRDRFVHLTELLLANRGARDTQQGAYKAWVGELFQQSRIGCVCSYCGAPVAPDDTGNQEAFCGEEHEQEFKKILWQVLEIFM